MATPTKRYIYRPWITLPNGTRIFARNYGKRVFRILIDNEVVAT